MVRFVYEEVDGVEGMDVEWIDGWMGVKERKGRMETYEASEEAHAISIFE